MGAFYIDITVFAICAMWIVWHFGFKPLFLDAFRSRLFELRVELFSMAETGKLSFDDEAYRTIETMLNGSIRFAHRLSFVTYIMSAWENSRAKREDKDYADFGQQVALKISRLQPEAQKELVTILAKLRTAVSLYMAATSVVIKVLLAGYFVARLFHAKKVEAQVTQQVYVIQREVYMSAKTGYSLARC